MTFSVVIPSKNPENCVACVRAVLENEPDLPPHRIIVVDDGARAEAESQLPGISWVDGIKPFVFARNINTGVRYARQFPNDGYVLLNDDARLLTAGGFTAMAETSPLDMPTDAPIGVLSPVFTDAVGNRNQLSQVYRRSDFPRYVRHESRVLAFVCVYVPQQTWDAIGELDERYLAYGWDDNDYCLRARNAGRRLAITEYCLLEHGTLPSTYRPKNVSVPTDSGRKIYEEKWGPHTE